MTRSECCSTFRKKKRNDKIKERCNKHGITLLWMVTPKYINKVLYANLKDFIDNRSLGAKGGFATGLTKASIRLIERDVDLIAKIEALIQAIEKIVSRLDTNESRI